jgi:hypothetical protein
MTEQGQQTGVKVIVFQVGEQVFPFVEGTTVGTYLEQAGAVVDKGVTLSLNNNKTTVEEVVEEDGSIIIVATKDGNG